MGARTGKFINDEGGGKVVACARQDAEHLLIWAANVVAILIGTWRAGIGSWSATLCWIVGSLVDGLAILRVVKRNLRAVNGLDGVSGIGRIDPSVAEVVEIRRIFPL